MLDSRRQHLTLSHRHDSASVWKQQLKLSQVFKKSLSTNIFILDDGSDTAAGVFTHSLSFEHNPQPVIVSYWPFSFSWLKLTNNNWSKSHKSEIFFVFSFLCWLQTVCVCLIQSGLKWTRQLTIVSRRALSGTQRLSSCGYQVIDRKWSITYPVHWCKKYFAQ